MTLIWATRGRSWGFRFLLDGGYSDPLPVYELAFVGIQDMTAGVSQTGSGMALRFPDPLARRDDSGRVIPHDIVVPLSLSRDITSVDMGVQMIWPLISDIYDQVWNARTVPDGKSIQSALAGRLDKRS